MHTLTFNLNHQNICFFTLHTRSMYILTLKSLIEEHACLDLSDFLSTLLAIFYVRNEKSHPARLCINLLIKKAGRMEFFSNPARLFWSALLLGTSE